MYAGAMSLLIHEVAAHKYNQPKQNVCSAASMYPDRTAGKVPEI